MMVAEAPPAEQEEAAYRGDFWDLFIVDHIHHDALFWSPWHVLKLLFSAGCIDVEVEAPLLPDEKAVRDGYVSLKITGECHDGEVTFTKDLYTADMSLEQRRAIVSLVRENYHQANYRAVRDSVAKALKVVIFNK